MGLWGMLLLVGCGKAETPKKPVSVPTPPPAIAAVAAEAPQKEAPKGEEKPTFAYEPKGKRDPFRSLIRVPTPSEKKEMDKHLPPLRREEIKNLKLVGIVWGDFGHEAVIETPDGKGYLVRHGASVGANRGVVSRIAETFLVIEERHIGVLGEVRMQEVVMALHPKKEEME